MSARHVNTHQLIPGYTLKMINFDSKRHMGAFREAISAELTPVIQVKFPYNIHPEYVETVLNGTGTVTQANSMATISTGASTSSQAQLLTKDTVVYQPGQGVTCRYTALFTPGAAGSKQLTGVGDDLDGYFIGFDGDKFGVLRLANGTEYWDYLPHIGDGEGSTYLRQLDFTKGNIYQIQYQWLGFGQIVYSVFNSNKQEYTVLHRTNYPNTAIEPSIYNPSVPICMMVQNTTNNTDVVIRTSSMAAFIEGKSTKLTHRHAVDNSKTITTETPILTIRAKETFEGLVNRALVFPDIVSMAADGTKSVKFRVYINATLGGTPVWADAETGDSVVEYDTAATSVSGGKLIASLITSKIGSGGFEGDRKVKIRKLDTFTITAESSSSNTVDVGISWEELI